MNVANRARRRLDRLAIAFRHVGNSELDATGHQRALPIRFIGLKSGDGRALDGVPKGGQEYQTD
jgi:hypothetical protein